ncbi:MAG TPA: YicC/YloC family endoribonuclease [Woeseiaceae bacterium]|nr:YicC/YloC family endoribonuclease [Woeseiaceae bacterium]
MLHSMTGFARNTAESATGVLTCELRTVNHRYFDVQFRLPEELRPKEADLRQLIGSVVRRGKADCTLHYRRASGKQAELRLNQALVEQIGRRADELKSVFPALGNLNAIDVLRWPGVIEEPEIDTEPLYEEAVAVIAAALEELTAMRRSEGQRIAEMIDSRCREILNIAASVRERMPEVLASARARQKERLDKLDIDADPARLEAELALVAQKLDVDEELDRLESHVSEIRSAIGSEEAVGRRLDFLMQELNREANTLGSKSADTATTRAAVELKVLIEQMREQIQNVE